MSYNKPSIAVPDSKKDISYHRDWCFSIINGSLTDTWANSYSTMSELYKFYQSGSNGELTQFLQKAQDGTDLPAYWTTTNTIKTKVDLLVGEMEERGYEIKVRAMNKEAIARKFEEKERLRVERKIQPVIKEAEAISGYPLSMGEYIPQSDHELEEYMDLSFKDKAEIIIEGALKWIAQRQEWDEHRKKIFMDVIIANKAIVRTEIVRGIPRSKRVDPLCFIADPDATDDMFSDATYFEEVEWMPLATAAEQFGLTLKELEEVQTQYETYLGLGKQGSQPVGDVAGFGSLATDRFKWFKKIDGAPRVMVIRACWLDVKEYNHKFDVNEKYGTEHLQRVESVQKKDKDKVIAKQLEVWRQCTIIGGQLVKNWGEVPNQPRTCTDLGKTECPYKVWVPNYYQSQSASKVEQLVGLQLFKDILMYNMQVQVSTSGGKGIIYDLAMLPENMTHDQVLAYTKTAHITFVNSKEYQMQGGANNIFRDYDMSLGQSINGILQLMQVIDSEMNNISGVSPERQGIVQGASSAVGVTQSALLQSNLITAPYFKGFERLCSRVLNYQAKLVKIAWAGKEVFAPIIGDVGIDFLKDNIDLELDDFDCRIESAPPILKDRATLDNYLGMYVQGANGNPEILLDALSIAMEPDLKVAVRKFTRKVLTRKMIEAKQQDQQAQQEQQMQAQAEQAQAQSQQAMLESQMELQNMKNAGNKEKTLITSRTKLNQTKLDLLKSK